MAIYLYNLVGSASIGVYSLATEKVVIIPKFVPLKKAERLGRWLKVKLIHTSIGGSVLVGALACANSNGILLPHFVRIEELETIKSVFEGNITVMETKKTAYGNMVLANDYGAIVDPRLKASEIEKSLKLWAWRLCRVKSLAYRTWGRWGSRQTRGFWCIPC